jgi:hypothetical protein
MITKPGENSLPGDCAHYNLRKRATQPLFQGFKWPPSKTSE